ncbi:hypothetical protein [Lentzea californiensis]|uniref:hypothetical protein n=1 Tax=Lentzea californiensis TaxID=438851 RepID=UPI0021652C51|nr:hypothetical protein [Lentzea californiensis]MCR3753741.1 hypothetical protein [Lentzea californiensis]
MRTKQLLAGLFVLLAMFTSTAAASADEARYCVTDLASGQRDCYSSSQEAQRAASAEITVLVAYDGFNYTGDVELFVSSTTCTTAYDNELNKKYPRIFLDDRISSWVTLDDCRVRFWDGPSFGPPQSFLSLVGRDCSDMRTCFGSQNWNNRPSSLALT